MPILFATEMNPRHWFIKNCPFQFSMDDLRKIQEKIKNHDEEK